MTEERRFEGCPDCGKDNGYLNGGSPHWAYCDEHRVRWFIGYNLYSSWKDETEEEQLEKWQRIEGYRNLTKERHPELFCMVEIDLPMRPVADDVPF